MFGLEFLYEQLNVNFGIASWGIAIIAFTFIMKSITFPLTLQSIRSMKRMQELQPKIQQINKMYKNDQAKRGEETMALYKEHRINPLAGCLPLLIQMPIWFALYAALLQLSTNNPEFSRPFLWITNLGQPEFTLETFPQQLPILAILSGVTQWITTKMAQQATTDPQQQMMNSIMQYMPIMFVFFAISVPAGLVLYWVASNVFQMVQQFFVTGWGLLPVPAAVRSALPGPRLGGTPYAPSATADVPSSGSPAGATASSSTERTTTTSNRRRRKRR